MKRARTRRAQSGTILMVVLVAMLAMMVSVIALSRSMDTNQMVAGNLAFRNASVHSSDAGILGAVQWLQSTVGTPMLNDDVPDRGYYASVIEPNWDDPALWANCPACESGDAAGNTVQWMVHRMCSAPGNPNNPGVSCSALTAGAAAAAGGSYAGDATNFIGGAQNYYRVTVRVVGPRNTSTLVQAFVSL